MSDPMEERFLKARQEREEQRLNRSKEVSEVTAQRRQFEEEALALEQAAETSISAANWDAAQGLINQLRTLVLDASNSVSLTAHDMVKANSTVTRLQQTHDSKKAAATISGGTAGGPSTATTAQAAGDGEASAAGAPRRFKFSKKVKTVSAATSGERDAKDVEGSTAPSETAAAGSQGATYGCTEAATVCVPPSRAAFVKDCARCTVLVAPIAGSLFVTNCVDCRLYVCCHQLRMKDCHNVQVYVWCASDPIIENCDEMGFGPYERWTGLIHSRIPAAATLGDAAAPLAYATHEEWVSKVGEIGNPTQTRESYRSVKDFQWLSKTQSPHWRVLLDTEQQEETALFSQPE